MLYTILNLVSNTIVIWVLKFVWNKEINNLKMNFSRLSQT